MKTFEEFMAESTYASKKDLAAIKKVIKRYTIGRVEAGRGAHSFKFEEKNFDNIIQALENAFGRSGKDIGAHIRIIADDGAEIKVEKPDPRLPPGFMFVTVHA